VVALIVIPLGINHSPDKSTPKEAIKISCILRLIMFLDFVRIKTKINKNT
jgi:hypothetical protein